MQAIVFCKGINFVEQRFKFSHFEGTIIPINPILSAKNENFAMEWRFVI